jgi:hypothetical protein
MSEQKVKPYYIRKWLKTLLDAGAKRVAPDVGCADTNDATNAIIRYVNRNDTYHTKFFYSILSSEGVTVDFSNSAVTTLSSDVHSKVIKGSLRGGTLWECTMEDGTNINLGFTVESEQDYLRKIVDKTIGGFLFSAIILLIDSEPYGETIVIPKCKMRNCSVNVQVFMFNVLDEEFPDDVIRGDVFNLELMFDEKGNCYCTITKHDEIYHVHTIKNNDFMNDKFGLRDVKSAIKYFQNMKPLG